jgi:hypothetical protein
MSEVPDAFLIVVSTSAVICLRYQMDTKIKGANLQATNQLNLNTKNLEVSSVHNQQQSIWYLRHNTAEVDTTNRKASDTSDISQLK